MPSTWVIRKGGYLTIRTTLPPVIFIFLPRQVNKRRRRITRRGMRRSGQSIRNGRAMGRTSGGARVRSSHNQQVQIPSSRWIQRAGRPKISQVHYKTYKYVLIIVNQLRSVPTSCRNHLNIPIFLGGLSGGGSLARPPVPYT